MDESPPAARPSTSSPRKAAVRRKQRAASAQSQRRSLLGSPARRSLVGSSAAKVKFANEVCGSLAKLDDLDTMDIAKAELAAQLERLSDASLVPTFISCVCDESGDSQRRVACRREVVALLGRTAEALGVSAYPHASKVIAFLSRRLLDADSSTRELAADSLAQLLQHCVPARAGASSGALVPFFNKLFSTLSGASAHGQYGAATAVHRLVAACSASEHLSGGLSQFLPHLVRKLLEFLARPDDVFMAKAPLIDAIAAVPGEQLAAWIEPIFQALVATARSTTWQTRRSAVVCLGVLADSALAPSLATFQVEGKRILDRRANDKITPVRDEARHALELWDTRVPVVPVAVAAEPQQEVKSPPSSRAHAEHDAFFSQTATDGFTVVTADDGGEGEEEEEEDGDDGAAEEDEDGDDHPQTNSGSSRMASPRKRRAGPNVSVRSAPVSASVVRRLVNRLEQTLGTKIDALVQAQEASFRALDARLTAMERALGARLRAEPNPNPQPQPQPVPHVVYEASAEQLPQPAVYERQMLQRRASSNPLTEALAYVDRGNLQAAYDVALENDDELLLMRLAVRTGVVLQQLERETCASLFHRFCVLLRRRQFVEHIFPWIHDALRFQREPPDHQPVFWFSDSLKQNLEEALTDLSTQATTSGVDARRLLGDIQTISKTMDTPR